MTTQENDPRYMLGVISGKIDLILLNQAEEKRQNEARFSERVRQRVLRERKKYVHAGVVGHVLAAAPEYERAGKRLRYNPYEGPSFTADGAPVRAADVVRLGADGRCQAWGTAA